jgi:hypothetical protein
MLLNIDKPLRTATLHSESCSHLPQPLGTPFKLVGSLGRDGGWFHVASRSEAEATVQREFPSAAFVRCSYC